MQAIDAVTIAAVGALTNLNHILAIFGRHNRAKTILVQQCVVVAAGQFKPSRVQDCKVGIKERASQTQPLEFRRDPLPLLRLHHEMIDVLILDNAGYR